jgi:glycosyltransferase involved in cell wall biosynthesis
MAAATDKSHGNRKLRIVHVLRAPLGGLFRHVLDLTREQVARGHAVGLITDSLTGGARSAAVLSELEPSLSLGLLRLPMPRELHPLDVSAALRVALHIRALGVDVVHGHGSKGGAYARLPAFLPGFGSPVRAYTPHGGSFNYRAGPLVERSYMAMERLLAHGTDIFLFESAYISRQFRKRVGPTRKLVRVVANGVSPAEFIPVEPMPDAAEFLYVGELRAAKGIDTLIDALASLASRLPKRPRLVLVGSGPDEAKLIAYAAMRGVADAVTFVGIMPAHEAFRLGRILVVPSRAESLPYIVLEAAAAQVPMVATDVGGISEIFGPYRDKLIPCDDPTILAAALETALKKEPSALRRESVDLAAFVGTLFTITDMADAVLAGYADALAKRSQRSDASAASFAIPSS